MPTYIDYLEATASLFFPNIHPNPTPPTNANNPTTTTTTGISPTTKRTAAFYLTYLAILTCWLIPAPFQTTIPWLSTVLFFIRALTAIKVVVGLAATAYAFSTTHFIPNDQELTFPYPYSSTPINELNLPYFEDFFEELRATSPAASPQTKNKTESKDGDEDQSEDRMCIVCWETLSDPAWPTLPCNHLVCESCLPRLAQATKQGDYCTCPYCRRLLFLGNTTTSTPTEDEDDDEVYDEDENTTAADTPPSAGFLIRRPDRFAQLGLQLLFDSGAV